MYIFSIISGERKDTYFFDNEIQQWNEGPQMSNARGYHGCGSFYIENKMVLIVAGHWDNKNGNGNSVEFLVPSDDEPEWITGKISLLFVLAFMLHIIFIFLGPVLPGMSSYLGHKIVSDSNTVYYVNTVDNFILKLECPSEIAQIASCEWILMDQKLSISRSQSLAFLVDDELTECSET